MSVVFHDRSQEFLAKVGLFTDTMMGLMAANIEAKAKTSGEIPFRKGALRSSVKHVKLGLGKYAVTAGTGSTAAAYAAAQEAGTVRGSAIKNYTTAGTGAHFMRHAIDDIIKRQQEFANKALSAAGLGGEF